jgi:hypothetical protein
MKLLLVDLYYLYTIHKVYTIYKIYISAAIVLYIMIKKMSRQQKRQIKEKYCNEIIQS